MYVVCPVTVGIKMRACSLACQLADLARAWRRPEYYGMALSPDDQATRLGVAELIEEQLLPRLASACMAVIMFANRHGTQAFQALEERFLVGLVSN